MARAIRESHLTPADELRSLLADSEKLIANLKGSQSSAVELLGNLDRIDALWPGLEAAGADLRAEKGRWVTLQSGVNANASRILRQLRHSGGLQALRVEAYPDGQAPWWWHLDRELAARARSRLLRIIIVAAAIVAVLFVAGRLVNHFFPVDPRVTEASGKILAAQTMIQNYQDYQGAFPLFEEAALLTPDDPEVWLWLGATQQKLGQTQDAVDSFQEAERLTPDPLDYHTQRGTIYLAFGMLDESSVDIDAALAIDPENPRAWMIRGGIYDLLGRYMDELQALQNAADFADQRGLAEVSATARFQMAMLMQRLPVIGAESTPDPSLP